MSKATYVTILSDIAEILQHRKIERYIQLPKIDINVSDLEYIVSYTAPYCVANTKYDSTSEIKQVHEVNIEKLYPTLIAYQIQHSPLVAIHDIDYDLKYVYMYIVQQYDKISANCSMLGKLSLDVTVNYAYSYWHKQRPFNIIPLLSKHIISCFINDLTDNEKHLIIGVDVDRFFIDATDDKSMNIIKAIDNCLSSTFNLRQKYRYSASPIALSRKFKYSKNQLDTGFILR